MDRRKFITLVASAFIAGCGGESQVMSRAVIQPPSNLIKSGSFLAWTASPTPGVVYRIYKNGSLHQDNISGTTYTPFNPQSADIFRVTAFKNGFESEPTDQLIWGT